MAKPEADVHVLRTVPPREFVHARDALVERLTQAGKSAEARQIRRLRRPSPVVWAVNRVAERHAQDLAALIDAVDRLRRAQLGQGEVRRTTDDYRQAFQRVVNRAGEVLREADTRVTPDLERRTGGAESGSPTTSPASTARPRSRPPSGSNREDAGARRSQASAAGSCGGATSRGHTEGSSGPGADQRPAARAGRRGEAPV
jgi:hypothetical protein